MSISQRKEVLQKLVEKLEEHAQYADALYAENSTSRLLKDVSDTEYSAHADAGVKLRAYDGRRFHEVAVQGWQPGLLRQEVEKLIVRLEANPPKGKTITLKVSKAQKKSDDAVTPQIDPLKVRIETKTRDVHALHESIMQHSDEFVNCQIIYREEREERVFVNKYKQLASSWSGCTVIIVPFVKTGDNQTRNDFYTNFANGYEVMDLDREELNTFLARAVSIKTARKLEPGKYTAILSPTVTGLLAHESFGHGMEADMMVHGRAKAAEYLGKKIASINVNICEDASLPSTHGFLFFDDEGEQPSRVYLVERGIVKHPITDAYSATMGKYTRTANGRIESFDHKAYARMTNTFFLPGKDDPKKMIKKVKNGIYIHTGSSGMEDPKGWGVQIAGLLCEHIKNGKLTGELYYEASMSGYLPDILKNIKAISSDFEIIKDVGFCGKNHKEWVRVSSGGPHLLIDEVELA